MFYLNNIYIFLHNNNGDYMELIKKNKIIFTFIIIFGIISFLSIYSASIYITDEQGKLYFKQILWYVVGIFLILFVNKIKLSTIYKYSFFIYMFGVILLIGLFFTDEINGSHAWYNTFGIISIQPSEFMKIFIIIFLSSLIYKFFNKEKKISTKKELKLIFLCFITVLLPSILTFLEPDTGSVIIYFVIFFSMLYISGINKKWFIFFLSFTLVLLTIFLLFYFFKQDLFVDIFGSSFFYRMDRIINFYNGSGMQLNNSLISIASGGITGHGFNNTPIYFPEAGTDFIFSVFTSNFGLLGSVGLISLLLSFNLYLIKISFNITSLKDKYTMVGIVSAFIYQCVQNIGMCIGILPITGITLPFISYGGSSVLSYMLLLGIIINIKETEEKKKAYK